MVEGCIKGKMCACDWCQVDGYVRGGSLLVIGVRSYVCSVVQVGERIRVILDCEDNTLAFEKNYEFLGK